MKVKFNEKAAAILARQFDLMAHEMFVVILGLSALKGTVVGVFVAGAVWLALVLFAFALRSVADEGGADAVGEDEEEDASG